MVSGRRCARSGSGGSSRQRRLRRRPGESGLGLERCEPRTPLAVDSAAIVPIPGFGGDDLVIVGGAADVDLAGARFGTLVNLSAGGTIDLSGAVFGALVNLVPGAVVRLDGTRCGTIYNGGEGATLDLSDVDASTIVNRAAGTRITLDGVAVASFLNTGAGVGVELVGDARAVRAAVDPAEAIDLSGVDWKSLTKKKDGSGIDLSGVDWKSLTKKKDGSGIDLSGVSVGAFYNTGDGVTIVSRGVGRTVPPGEADGTHADFAGLSVGTLINTGGGATIDLSGVRFETLANLGESVAVSLREATFGALANLGGGGTRIDVAGGGFTSLANTADGVALVRVAGASFGTVRNDGDRLGLLDVTVGAGVGTLLNDGSETTIRFVGGEGDDLFVNDASCDGAHGDGVRFDVDLGAGADRAVLGGATLSGRIAGGAGDDDYVFTGAVGGAFSIGEAPQAGADTLDFSRVRGGGVGIDLGSARPQEVRRGLVLELACDSAIENVVGTPEDDVIRGNSRGGVLLGADPADDRGGAASVGSGRTQAVVLDFDARTDPGEHAYAADERAAIVAALSRLYGPFGVSFATGEVAGAHATVYFNESRAEGAPGGQAGEIDFGNVDSGGTATVQVEGLLGLPGGPAESSDAWVAASVWMAAHETGHLLGLRHADSQGPVGAITAGFAWGSNDHVMATPALTGFTLDDLVRDHFFGTREAVKLAFARYAPVEPDGRLLVAEGAVTAPEGLQTLSLVRLPVPNVATRGFEAATEPVVAAVAATGAVSAPGQRDRYRVEGRAGDLLNLQVMSQSLSRLAGESFDAVLEVRDAAGNVVAFSDDDAECTDPEIVDLRLPADGEYVVEVRGYSPAATGEYELFAWRYDTASLGTGTDLLLARVSPSVAAALPTAVPLLGIVWETSAPRGGGSVAVSGVTPPAPAPASAPAAVAPTGISPSATAVAARGITRGTAPRVLPSVPVRSAQSGPEEGPGAEGGAFTSR